jgi:hypothetical protein
VNGLRFPEHQNTNLVVDRALRDPLQGAGQETWILFHLTDMSGSAIPDVQVQCIYCEDWKS